MYEFSNKVSRTLAKSIRTKLGRTYIPKLRCLKKGLVHSFEDITQTFYDYYTTLYNMFNSFTAPASMQGREKLLQYILSTALPKIDQSIADSLNIPFSIEEILQTIKALLSGKSPGPDSLSSVFYKQFPNML